MAAKQTEIGVDVFREDIAEMLKGADLNSLTSKKVRQQLEKKHNTSLSHRKQEIDRLLMKMIESENDDESDDESNDESDESADIADTTEKDHVNGDGSHKDKSIPSKSTSSSSTPRRGIKKGKVSAKEDVQDDEELARTLQEQERGLRTRICKKQVNVKTEKGKKKSEKKERGYGAVMILSDDLAELMGERNMRRQDVVKKMWEIIKARNLTDPKNKKFTICDDELFKVIGRKRFLTFSMLKFLKRHMKDPSLLAW